MKIRIPVRIGIIVVLLLMIIGLQYFLSHSSTFLSFYGKNIFSPLQRARSFVLDHTQVSIGDYLYLILAVLLLAIIFRVLYFGFTFRKNKGEFYIEGLRLLTFPLVLYLFFLVLWGGNYDRPALSKNWAVQAVHWDENMLIRLNNELLEKLNQFPDSLVFPGDQQLNQSINAYYHTKFGDCVPQLKVKTTSLGNMLNYLGIQGYYNPFSGEGQFNSTIPPFMHPFVIAHEMAHQVGIAAEDDANLIAYIICSESPETAIRYSASFNLFLYAQGELAAYNRDAAKSIFNRLNASVRNNIDTLRAMNRRYRSRFRKVSSSLYDEYLRLHGQEEGLETYSFVTRWAWFWDHHQKQKADVSVCP